MTDPFSTDTEKDIKDLYPFVLRDLDTLEEIKFTTPGDPNEKEVKTYIPRFMCSLPVNSTIEVSIPGKEDPRYFTVHIPSAAETSDDTIFVKELDGPPEGLEKIRDHGGIVTPEKFVIS